MLGQQTSFKLLDVCVLLLDLQLAFFHLVHLHDTQSFMGLQLHLTYVQSSSIAANRSGDYKPREVHDHLDSYTLGAAQGSLFC